MQVNYHKCQLNLTGYLSVGTVASKMPNSLFLPTGKDANESTFKRFLAALTQDISV